MEKRLIVEQFDPERPKPGGIDTCIRGLVKYCPPDIELCIAGVDATGGKTLGQWVEHEIGGRKVQFMPVARLDHADLRRVVPHSIRVAMGLRKFRPSLNADVVQSHRINMGATVMRLYPNADHVQFIHSSGSENLKKGSKSFFRRAIFAYRMLEQNVIPRSIDTVVFSKQGAERLQNVSKKVRFSPTWYDPAEFYPSDREERKKTKIIWACRIEPAKNPELAIDVLSRLSDEYTLTVAGSGTLSPLMESLAQESPAKDRITFLGAVPKAEIGAVMREHHLMLMTSRFEGYSRAIVEGLASGLPVVTTPGGEPNGLVETGKNGARVPDDQASNFVPAFAIAANISASAARSSVAGLSAANIVPDVLTIPRLKR